MKLATLNNQTRDGELLVVSTDLSRAVKAKHIAPTLQKAIDHWATVHDDLQELYLQLNNEEIMTAFPFNPLELMAPLPRAYQWADASAYLNHVELVRKARGATMPEEWLTDPLMYQGGSDTLISARDDIKVEHESYGIDLEAEIAIITNDVNMGVEIKAAHNHIKLLMLANDVSLRNLIPKELAKGFGFFQSKPSTAFSPVAVTPDELKDKWDGGKVHLPIYVYVNGQLIGQPNAGVDMNFDFPTLIVHAAKTRALAAGTIIGSGTISNKDKHVGTACLMEKRMRELLDTQSINTEFLRFGDTIRIEMLDDYGHSIFGAIEQRIVKYEK